MRLEMWRTGQRKAWKKGIEDYLATALRYYERDYAGEDKAALLSIVNTLAENKAWHPGFESLRDSRFFGYRCVLPVLLSIRYDRSFGYSKQFSVYQVIEAGLRSGSRAGQHAFAILYLWSYKTYRPEVSRRNRKWLSDYGHKVKRAVDAGEETYRRDTEHDEAISLLFPELEKHLVTSFGTGE